MQRFTGSALRNDSQESGEQDWAEGEVELQGGG